MTPLGSPLTLKAVNCVNPFELDKDTCTSALCPGNKVKELGPAVSEKLEDETTESELEELVLRPSTAILISPPVAPDGITKERVLAVALDIGATIVPPPS